MDKTIGIQHIPDQSLPSWYNPLIPAHTTAPLNLSGCLIEYDIQLTFTGSSFWSAPTSRDRFRWYSCGDWCRIGYNFTYLFYLYPQLWNRRTAHSFVQPMLDIDYPHDYLPRIPIMAWLNMGLIRVPKAFCMIREASSWSKMELGNVIIKNYVKNRFKIQYAA